MSSTQYVVERSGRAAEGVHTEPKNRAESEVQGAGSWIERMLAEHGLADIAASVAKGAPLTLSQARVLTRAPVPLVLRLAERRLPEPTIESLLRPVSFVPLGTMLAEKGKAGASAEAAAAVEKALEQTPEKTSLHIAIDSWKVDGGRQRVPYELVLDTLAELREQFAPHLRLIGPSTGELKSLLPESDPSHGGAPVVLRAFLAAGIERVEGGNDLKIHLAAANAGLSATFAHNLVRSRISRTDDAPRADSRPFLEELFELREKLFPAHVPETWYPWSSVVLDHGQPKQEAPLGFEVLFAVALARICLPEVRFIRAPLSMVGARMAELALQFGANDLGFAAVDADTADQLGLVRWQIAVRELQVREL